MRWLIVSSPEYHCQFVFVTKLIATLNAPIGADAGAVGRVERQRTLQALQQRTATSTDTRLNAISDSA